MAFHRTYDPLVGFVNDAGDFHGLEIWPEDVTKLSESFRVFVTGGSTSILSLSNLYTGEKKLSDDMIAVDRQWPVFLAGMLSEYLNREVAVFNAAACGYSTSQELFRIIRDTPGVEPDLIISLSGANDFGFIHSAVPHAMTHPYQQYVAVQITNGSEELTGYNLGVPQGLEAHEIWLRNIKIMKYVSDINNAAFFACLQPLMGVSPTRANTEEEKAFIDGLTNRKVNGFAYLEVVKNFYESLGCMLDNNSELREFIFNMRDIFSSETERIWADSRHLTVDGNRKLAEAVYRRLLSSEAFQNKIL